MVRNTIEEGLLKWTNLDSIFKSRDITLSTKVCLVKAMVFPVVMYGCESWTIKKAECQRIDAFELWCWRRLLRVPWTARRSNESILKISPGCSLEGLMLKLKLQYFGHLMRRADWLIGKDLNAGKDWGQEEKGPTEDEMVGWHHWLNGHEFEWTPGVGDGQGGLAYGGSWGHKELDKTEQLNWSMLLWQYPSVQISLFFLLRFPLSSTLLFFKNVLFLERDYFLDLDWLEKQLRMWPDCNISRKKGAVFPPRGWHSWPTQRSSPLPYPPFPLFFNLLLAFCCTGKTTGSTGLPPRAFNWRDVLTTLITVAGKERNTPTL